MSQLKDMTLFITGASRGIGKAIALRAARDGARIVIAAKTAEPDPRLPGTILPASVRRSIASAARIATSKASPAWMRLAASTPPTDSLDTSCAELRWNWATSSASTCRVAIEEMILICAAMRSPLRGCVALSRRRCADNGRAP